MDVSRIFELRLKGYCCSQIILKMGIQDAQKDENPDLIQAVAGLCNGLHSGSICGILSGAACLISLVNPENAKDLSIELVEWFRNEFETNNGITCKDILDGDQMNRSKKCPFILAATYDTVLELLDIDF
ncbi:hypothetical protein UNSWDHB_426 [Dehalobacter sp. UNSWDHB]|uniref:DVU_1555 family C-GCAxxG-C-C protein n=1 Tax=Dehalobacter sp. UNSWDHB TaxID=1339256 RepID=UPI0003877E5F|nr:DV_1555 family C-GCAxxG-C-C protein [Dehalobacter sp. UNSWDHB]EQB22210.1 hypothetical protein UNSWDHB_426 [Dehalobacter sp. UNSWDHB]